MREIKFRVWNTMTGHMWQLQRMNFKNGQLLYEGSNMPTPKENKSNHIIMQYTGLKDKNNKEIYEGDIIEGGYENPLGEGFVSKKYVIEYDNEKGGFMGRLQKHSPYGDTWIQFIIGEVIGNIYENPELLEE